jgi:hypothetical protein
MKTVYAIVPALLMLLPAGSKQISVINSSPDAQAAFDRLKALDGVWEGTITTEPAIPAMTGDVATITLRVASMGNALVHTMASARRPDNPISVIYLEDSRLLLTHYCDGGNRPRMEARISADGNTVSFEFLDISGPTRNGHMSRAVFTFKDASHHVQEWTYVMPNGAQVRVRSDLRRVANQPG